MAGAWKRTRGGGVCSVVIGSEALISWTGRGALGVIAPCCWRVESNSIQAYISQHYGMALLKPACSPDNLADLTLPLLINVLQSQLMAMYTSQLMAMYTKHCPLRKSTRNSRHKCSRRYLAHKNRALSTTPQRKRFALDSHATPALQSYGLPTHLRLAHAMPMPMCLYAPMRRYKQYPPPLPQNNDTPSPQTPSSPLRPVKCPGYSPLNPHQCSPFAPPPPPETVRFPKLFFVANFNSNG